MDTTPMFNTIYEQATVFIRGDEDLGVVGEGYDHICHLRLHQLLVKFN